MPAPKTSKRQIPKRSKPSASDPKTAKASKLAPSKPKASSPKAAKPKTKPTARLLGGSDKLLRKLALQLPEASEAPHFDMPSFRVNGKIFATARLNEPKAMLKLPLELQHLMTTAHPGVIEPVPGSWGQKGATFIATDKIEESLLADLIASAWINAAPKSLRAQYAALAKRGHVGDRDEEG